jgi:hypothetical protein
MWCWMCSTVLAPGDGWLDEAILAGGLLGMGQRNWTPLHTASISGHAHIVRLLLERRAAVDPVTKVPAFRRHDFLKLMHCKFAQEKHALLSSTHFIPLSELPQT